MSDKSNIANGLRRFSGFLLSCVLTQVCRDPNSSGYGAFDRNWWHYKIRDFPSIILQQGGYALYCASQVPEISEEADALKELAAASCRFWNSRAVKYGAFEEYYPWEQGYPPVAFSSLAVSKLVAEGVVPLEAVYPGIRKAAAQLQKRFEHKACNQQVAGMAALCWIRKLDLNLVVVAQIEHIDAIQNLKEIAQVDGIDGTFIGPYDLSGSMGMPGEYGQPEVVQALEEYKAVCRGLNKSMGYHVVEPDVVQLWDKMAEGYRMLAFSTDFLFMERSAAEKMEQANV